MQSLKQPFIKKNRYYNTPDDVSCFSLGDLFKTAYQSINHFIEEKTIHLGKKDTFQDTSIIRLPQKHHLVWLGHATFVISLPNCTIITDPILGSPSLFLQRIFDNASKLEHFESIDLVLISHNHRDHMDIASLKKISTRFPHATFAVPVGNAKILEKAGIEKVMEYNWWERFLTPTNELIQCTLLPAHHWSQRGIFDQNKSLWGSWMIEYGDSRYYFAGDTAYDEHFSLIAKHFPPITYALLPIGPGGKRKDLRKAHMNAEDAGQAFLDLKAQNCIPMHWGTFALGDDYPLEPLERILAWWINQQKRILVNKKLLLPF